MRLFWPGCTGYSFEVVLAGLHRIWFLGCFGWAAQVMVSRLFWPGCIGYSFEVVLAGLRRLQFRGCFGWAVQVTV